MTILEKYAFWRRNTSILFWYQVHYSIWFNRIIDCTYQSALFILLWWDSNWNVLSFKKCGLEKVNWHYFLHPYLMHEYNKWIYCYTIKNIINLLLLGRLMYFHDYLPSFQCSFSYIKKKSQCMFDIYIWTDMQFSTSWLDRGPKTRDVKAAMCIQGVVD